MLPAEPDPVNSPNIFQVAPTATEQELKKAYKTGALKYHPGKFSIAAQDIV